MPSEAGAQHWSLPRVVHVVGSRLAAGRRSQRPWDMLAHLDAPVSAAMAAPGRRLGPAAEQAWQSHPLNR